MAPMLSSLILAQFPRAPMILSHSWLALITSTVMIERNSNSRTEFKFQTGFTRDPTRNVKVSYSTKKWFFWHKPAATPSERWSLKTVQLKTTLQFIDVSSTTHLLILMWTYFSSSNLNTEIDGCCSSSSNLSECSGQTSLMTLSAHRHRLVRSWILSSSRIAAPPAFKPLFACAGTVAVVGPDGTCTRRTCLSYREVDLLRIVLLDLDLFALVC